MTSSVESSFLKDELGPVLAKGLAAVAVARPEDPVEYLALWMLHYAQVKEAKAAEVEAARLIEAEREAWQKSRGIREKSAANVIQREWKAHTKLISETQAKELELKKKFQSIDETAEELVPDEKPSGAEKSEKEAAAELERLTTQTAFKRAQLYIAAMDKSVFADFKNLSSSNYSTATVVKCCLYLAGARPRQLDTWEKIRAMVKPHPFAVALQSFDPLATPLPRKRRIARVRRLLTTVDENSVRNAGAAIATVYNWLNALVACRDARDEDIRVRRAAGKEVDEELDEDEDGEEGEEKDPEEEKVKAVELEAKKQAEADALAAAADDAPADAGADDQ